MSGKKVRVLIVDDSALIREMFREMLDNDPDIEVIGAAKDPYDAREKIKELNPDVITLDIEMPKMDGLTFLEKIMKLRPMPVVMASTLTQRGAAETIKCLEIGAVDYVSKPVENQTRQNLSLLETDLRRKVKTAAGARVRYKDASSAIQKASVPEVASKPSSFSYSLIAIGSSTGGVEALRELLVSLPKDMPPIVIVQHMPANFTKSFSSRLNDCCHLNVQEAKNGDILKPGNVYLAEGDKHLAVVKKGSVLSLKAFVGEKVSGHCPSVDVLFNSVSESVGKESLGVILTGMGKDGADGMLKMKRAGSYNLGQNEASCVVYGMPKAARMNNAIDKEVHLKNMAKEILQCLGYKLL